MSDVSSGKANNQHSQDREVEREMGCETPVLTGMPKAAAGDIESTTLRDDTCSNEDDGKAR